MFYMVDDFTVVKKLDDGTTVEHKFTSHAQARQFMENNAGQAPPIKPTPQRSGQNRRAPSKPVQPQTAEQRALKAEALKQFKGI